MLRGNHISIRLEGWYFLIVLTFIVTGAILREINLLVVLTGMLVGPFLFNWWMVTLTLRRIDVRRKLPESICAGDLLVVELDATNSRRRLASWAIAVQDPIHREGAGFGEKRMVVSTMFPRVPAGQSATTSYRGRLIQRGRYTFGPLRISTSFPLGLLCRTVVINRKAQLVVCPRLGQLTPKWIDLIQTRMVGNQRTRRRHGLIEGDFYGLRDWRSGDSRRWIHWRTSAKRGALTVRQFEQQQNQNTTVLLDLWQPSRPTQRQLDNVEIAVSFAATVVADLCRRGGSQLQVCVAGKSTTRVRGAASMVVQQEVMEMLSGTMASHKDGLPELLDRALDRSRPESRTVVISTRETDLSDTERFVQVWDHPRKRNVMSQVVCLDVSADELDEYFQVE